MWSQSRTLQRQLVSSTRLLALASLEIIYEYTSSDHRYCEISSTDIISACVYCDFREILSGVDVPSLHWNAVNSASWEQGVDSLPGDFTVRAVLMSVVQIIFSIRSEDPCHNVLRLSGVPTH